MDHKLSTLVLTGSRLTLRSCLHDFRTTAGSSVRVVLRGVGNRRLRGAPGLRTGAGWTLTEMPRMVWSGVRAVTCEGTIGALAKSFGHAIAVMGRSAYGAQDTGPVFAARAASSSLRETGMASAADGVRADRLRPRLPRPVEQLGLNVVRLNDVA